jgi:LacI family transcriptional regulator
MGYRPNAIAQNLATGRANRIGFYSGRARLDCRNPFFAEVLGGVFDGAEELGIDTLVHTSGASEGRIIDLVRGHTLDGLIVYAAPGDPILRLLGGLHVPAVAIADEIEGLPSVAVDDHSGGMLLAGHLASLGHGHVLVKQSPAPPRSAIKRVQAFREGCESAGMRVTQGYETWDGAGLNEEELRAVSEGPERVSAVMAWSDAVAELVCEHLQRVGIRVPYDVSVVGFDGFRHRHPPRYDLTTIEAPWALAGREAVRLANAQIAGDPIPEITVLPVTLHAGNSSGPARG